MSALSNAANVLNAQFSSGPTTPEGKERVKFNALKTGIFARTMVLPNEDQSAYEALGAYLNDRFQPADETEREVVLTIQNSTWRLNRIATVESGLYAIATNQQLEKMAEMFPDQTPDVNYNMAQAAGYLAHQKAFEQLSRQEGRLQRMLDRANRELLGLINARAPRPEPVQQPVAAPPAPPKAQPINQPAPANGFVSPKYPKHMPSFTGPHYKETRRQWLIANGYSNLA